MCTFLTVAKTNEKVTFNTESQSKAAGIPENEPRFPYGKSVILGITESISSSSI